MCEYFKIYHVLTSAGTAAEVTVVPVHVALAAQYTCRHAGDLVKLKVASGESSAESRTVRDCPLSWLRLHGL